MPATVHASPVFRRTLLTSALVMGAACWLGGHARAATPTSSEAVLEAVQVPAWVERDGDRRAAEPGQRLRAGDKALTAAGSRVVFRLPDNSLVKLGEATELDIEALTVKRGDAPAQMDTRMNLVTGVFRWTTDYASKARGETRDLALRTATATVGVRGTDFWTMTDADHDAVCVFEGHVEVMPQGKPSLHLDKPGAFWVTFTGQPDKPAGQATPAELAKFIGQGELQPGKGVMLAGGTWRVVVGLLQRPVDAAALRGRLQKAGYPARVQPTPAGQEVLIAQLATQADALAVLGRLQADASVGASQGRVVNRR